MLSIGKLTGGAGSARYYEGSVATGREDCYTGEGEAPGRWMGTGAASLVLDGVVAPGSLERLLVEGAHPSTGEQLRSTRAHVHGFDLTFSAPKSVSVLQAMGIEEVSAAVVAAHTAAIHDALGYLEREAVQVRRGRGGRIREHAGGLVAAAYRHRMSRAGDPQLHTHVVAANLAQGADGRWTALHAAPLYTHAKTASYLYQASLRHQLGRELGVQWGPVCNGIADVAGVPRSVIEHFSQRRAEIREAMAARGVTSARAAQTAALQTRRAKQHDPPTSSIYERWRARAAEHGFTTRELAAAINHPQRPPDATEHRAFVAALSGESGLTAQASTFTRRDVIRAFAEQHRAGAETARIEQLADRWLASELAVQLEGDRLPPARAAVIATARGRRVVEVEPRYSTPDMLATERRLLADALRRQGEGAAVAQPGALAAATAERPWMADEQQSMVRALTQSGDGVQVVRAKAGAGKTTALDAARDAWQRSGIEVQGAALGSFAARELRDSGIEACTIAALLRDLRAPGGCLPRGSVLIVDEAGMVGTRTLATLAAFAHRSRIKLVLVGDDRQLPEIDAGGAFRGLADRLGAVELHHNRRQRDPDDRRALDAHRDGRPDELIAALRRRGHIAVAPDVEQTRRALVVDWWTAADAGGLDEAVMVALRRSEVRALNALARDRMRSAGRLGDRELVIADQLAFAVGDRIVTRQNDRRLGVVNGSRGEVIALGSDRSLTVRLDDGADATLPGGYITGQRRHQPFIEHGYAVTAHGLQGATVDRTFVLGSEELYRGWGYVAFSRHRIETRFYLAAPEAFGGELSVPSAPRARSDSPWTPSAPRTCGRCPTTSSSARPSGCASCSRPHPRRPLTHSTASTASDDGSPADLRRAQSQLDAPVPRFVIGGSERAATEDERRNIDRSLQAARTLNHQRDAIIHRAGDPDA